MTDQPEKQTRPLTPQDASAELRMPIRATGPLDEALPWVLEFRIVGTVTTIPVQVHEAMTIGRGDPTRGVLPSVDLGPHGGQAKGVSRMHAVVLVKDNRIRIKDLGSVNGTRLNGNLLAQNQEYRLRHGDELDIGQMRLQVQFAFEPTMGESDSSVVEPQRTAIPKVGTGQTILVAEDDADIGKVIRLALITAGYAVTLTTNAEETLREVTRKMPACVIFDAVLPDMGGLDLVKLIRGQAGGESVPCMQISSVTRMEQVSLARLLGVERFINRPISVEELLEAVKGALNPEPKPAPLPSAAPATEMPAVKIAPAEAATDPEATKITRPESEPEVKKAD